MKSIIKPKRVGEKARVIIVAPSGKISKNQIQKAITKLKQWGFKVKEDNDLYNGDGYFAGTAKEREKAFQQAIDSSYYDIVMCARGGYGITKYVDQIDLSLLKINPKWIIGFSDITALHSKLFNAGICSIHGPMATSFEREGMDVSLNSILELIKSGNNYIEGKFTSHNQVGKVKAPLIGGNLSMLCDGIGTSSELNTDDAILVLEDVGEGHAKIDRMLTHMKRAKKLDSIKGLVVGSFSQLDDEKTFGYSLEQMILSNIDKSIPVAFGMPIGHTTNNIAFMHGAKYQMVVNSKKSYLTLLDKLG